MEFLPEPAWPIRVNGLVVEEVEAPFGFVKFGANACRGERASSGWTRMDENPIAPVIKLSRHQSQLLMMSSCAIIIVKEGNEGVAAPRTRRRRLHPLLDGSQIPEKRVPPHQLLMMSSCAITIVKEGDVGAGGAKDSPKATASGS